MLPANVFQYRAGTLVDTLVVLEKTAHDLAARPAFYANLWTAPKSSGVLCLNRTCERKRPQKTVCAVAAIFGVSVFLRRKMVLAPPGERQRPRRARWAVTGAPILE